MDELLFYLKAFGRRLANCRIDCIFCYSDIWLEGCTYSYSFSSFLCDLFRLNFPDSPTFAPKKAEKRSIGRKVRKCWSKKYARRTFVFWIVWFTVVFSYYGMFLWLPSVMVMKGFSMIQSFDYVLIMTLAQLPGYFSAAWLIERGEKVCACHVSARNSRMCTDFWSC